MIISPVCSFEDVTYGMYNTSIRIYIASEYGCDVYTKALDKLSSKMTSYEDTLFAFVQYVNKIPFLMLWNSNEDTSKTLLRLVTYV